MLKQYLIILTALLACLQLKAQDVSNKSYPVDPADKPSADVPKGEVLEFHFDHSNIYPGTQRRYWIYIPAAYKPEKPACLYVCMDGVAFNAPTIFDELITKGEMPVTIGVFIESGHISKADGSVLRFNRTNEFDNMNDRFARFIETEILPDVMKRRASDGRKINISPDANDHAIAGASSGAICAFTAAWNRPDLFTRVFSAIGTYIGMRGGDQYPVLIRKSDPKPIRVYLQDNNNDTWNPLFGNWFKSNIDMEAALNFAGYEVTNMWQEGGHDGSQATHIFADAMRWLWKGWPQPVKAGWSANDMLKTILIKDEGWQLANEALPVLNDTVQKIELPNKTQYFLMENRTAGTSAIFIKGSDFAYEQDEDPNIGHAMAISPDKSQLVVSGKHSHWLYDYAIAADGSLTDKQTLYWMHNPGNNDTTDITSMAFDTSGNLYIATDIGVQVCDQNGRVRAILSLPGGAITQLYFGGDNLETLFVVCGGKLFKRKMKTAGAPSSKDAKVPVSQGAG